MTNQAKWTFDGDVLRHRDYPVAIHHKPQNFHSYVPMWDGHPFGGAMTVDGAKERAQEYINEHAEFHADKPAAAAPASLDWRKYHGDQEIAVEKGDLCFWISVNGTLTAPFRLTQTDPHGVEHTQHSTLDLAKGAAERSAEDLLKSSDKPTSLEPVAVAPWSVAWMEGQDETLYTPEGRFVIYPYNEGLILWERGKDSLFNVGLASAKTEVEIRIQADKDNAATSAAEVTPEPMTKPATKRPAKHSVKPKAAPKPTAKRTTKPTAKSAPKKRKAKA